MTTETDSSGYCAACVEGKSNLAPTWHSSGRAEPDAISPDVSAVMGAVRTYEGHRDEGWYADEGCKKLWAEIEQAAIAACERYAQQRELMMNESQEAELNENMYSERHPHGWPSREMFDAEGRCMWCRTRIERDEAQRDARALAEALREIDRLTMGSVSSLYQIVEGICGTALAAHEAREKA